MQGMTGLLYQWDFAVLVWARNKGNGKLLFLELMTTACIHDGFGGADPRENGLNLLVSLGGMFGIGQLRQPVPTCLGLKCGRAGRQFLKWDAAADLKRTVHAKKRKCSFGLKIKRKKKTARNKKTHKMAPHSLIQVSESPGSQSDLKRHFFYTLFKAHFQTGCKLTLLA